MLLKSGCPALFRGKSRTVGQPKKKYKLSRTAQKKVGQLKKSRTVQKKYEFDLKRSTFKLNLDVINLVNASGLRNSYMNYYPNWTTNG